MSISQLEGEGDAAGGSCLVAGKTVILLKKARSMSERTVLIMYFFHYHIYGE